MPVEKVTSKQLIEALRRKYPQLPILSEVTMEDEKEAHRNRTAQAQRSVYYKRAYDKRGLSYDAELPEGYDVTKSVTFRRIDALMWDSQQKTAVEVKISRADFFRDTDAKRDAWKRHTHRFVYLVPKGLIKLEELPLGCGLWEYENGSITVTKKAIINKEVQDFPESMVRYFAWRAFDAENKLQGRRTRY